MYNLCLSGGGFRATLFHIGVIRRLVYLGMFDRIREINSVSGGSIAAGMVISQLTTGGKFKDIYDFDRRVTIPMIKFIQSSPKKEIYRVIPVHRNPKRLVKVLCKIYGKLNFKEIQTSIKWNCYATDLKCATYWKFSKNSIGNTKVGFINPKNSVLIASGVAASACFMPVFKPLIIKEKRGRDSFYLGDGGIFDNYGVTEIIQNKDYMEYETIVSDASGIIERWEHNKLAGLCVYKRAMDIAMGMSGELKRREIDDRIVKEGRGRVVHLQDSVESYIDSRFFINHSQKIGKNPPVYDKVDRKIQKELGDIRTDFNAFHDLEIELLMWSGETKIDAVMKKWKPYDIDKEKWSHTPYRILGNYSFKETMKILKIGDEMKIFESHNFLHKGEKYVNKLARYNYEKKNKRVKSNNIEKNTK